MAAGARRRRGRRHRRGAARRRPPHRRRARGAVRPPGAPRVAGSGRAGGLARSAPSVARWLGDIRRYFPTPVVQVLQRDAVERLELRQLLLEPELLGELEPDLHLVTLLVELNRALPEATRATARQVVAQVLAQLEARLADRTRQAVHGALARAQRTRRPRPADIDWLRTIRTNLRHWLPEHRTVVPEHLVGFGRHQRSLARDLDHRRRPERVDGRQHRPRLGVRLRARPAAGAAHVAGRVRHRRRRPDAAARRPRRRAVRRPARRRDGHRGRARLLPPARHPPSGLGPAPDQRPVRGRQRRPPCAPGSPSWSATA